MFVDGIVDQDVIGFRGCVCSVVPRPRPRPVQWCLLDGGRYNPSRPKRARVLSQIAAQGGI